MFDWVKHEEIVCEYEGEMDEKGRALGEGHAKEIKSVN